MDNINVGMDLRVHTQVVGMLSNPMAGITVACVRTRRSVPTFFSLSYWGGLLILFLYPFQCARGGIYDETFNYEVTGDEGMTADGIHGA